VTGIRRIGRYYTFAPGRGPDGAPEEFPPGWDGLTGKDGVLAQARKASAGNRVPRVVRSVRGRDETVICTITDGVAVWPVSARVIPARRGRTS
jgi:hypothetical protein